MSWKRQSREIYGMRNHIDMLGGKINYEQRKNQKLTQELIDLKRTNDQFEADLREVQVKSFKEMVKSTWTPMEDQVISDILNEVHKEIEDWADENCVDIFEEMEGKLTEEEQTEFLEYLKDITIVATDDFGQQLGWWTEKGSDPVLILTAAMTHLMYDKICSNEFAVVDALVIGGNVSGPLQQTYRGLLDGKHEVFLPSNFESILTPRQ